jgi:hypothetical protein
VSGKHPAAFQRRDESAHPLIQDALAKEYLDSGLIYPVDGFTDHESANQGRLSANRAGRHHNIAISTWVVNAKGDGCWKDGSLQCTDPEGPHGIRFTVHSKNAARGHIVAKSGGDPSRLKYNPFAKHRAADYRDDDGNVDV